jgi:acetyltransferase
MDEPTPEVELPESFELRDGTPIRLRLGTPEDREALVAGFNRLSAESRVSRFFTGVPRLSGLFLDHLLDVDALNHVAIAAEDMSRESEVGDARNGFGVGVARYMVDRDDPTRAEMAVAVVDDYQGRGLGTRLLDALVRYAAAHGVTTATATVLSLNAKMLSMLETMGATPHWDPDDRTVVELEIPIGPDEAKRSRVHEMLGAVAKSVRSTPGSFG